MCQKFSKGANRNEDGASNKNLPHNDDYLLPDRQRSVENLYVFLDETCRAENDQDASLATPQHVVYQDLAGKSLLSSECTIPKNTLTASKLGRSYTKLLFSVLLSSYLTLML